MKKLLTRALLLAISIAYASEDSKKIAITISTHTPSKPLSIDEKINIYLQQEGRSRDEVSSERLSEVAKTIEMLEKVTGKPYPFPITVQHTQR